MDLSKLKTCLHSAPCGQTNPAVTKAEPNRTTGTKDLMVTKASDKGSDSDKGGVITPPKSSGESGQSGRKHGWSNRRKDAQDRHTLPHHGSDWHRDPGAGLLLNRRRVS